MAFARSTLALTVAAALIGLAACGQKGPLVLPADAKAAPAPAAAAPAASAARR